MVRLQDHGSSVSFFILCHNLQVDYCWRSKGGTAGYSLPAEGLQSTRALQGEPASPKESCATEYIF